MEEPLDARSGELTLRHLAGALEDADQTAGGTTGILALQEDDAVLEDLADLARALVRAGLIFERLEAAVLPGVVPGLDRAGRETHRAPFRVHVDPRSGLPEERP